MYNIGGEHLHQDAAPTLERAQGLENALACASLLTGIEEISGMTPEEAEIRFREWWVAGPAANCSLLAEKLNLLPEPFMTVHFHNRTRPLAGRLATMAATIERLWRNEISFVGAMSQISSTRKSGQDTEPPWHQAVDELAALMRWTPAFDQASEYVRSALPSGDPDIDRIRISLLDSIDKPDLFLAADERDSFDRSFLDYKTRYVEAYARAHDETVGMMASTGAGAKSLDAAALRNLEILSGLTQADRRCLERIRMTVTWLKNHRCDLPVRRILDRYPRCFCNFLPGADLSLQVSVGDLNAMIRGGIERIRESLRGCGVAIIEELKSLGISESDFKQVAALLGQGPVADLRPRTIELLNALVQRQPSRFQIGVGVRPR